MEIGLFCVCFENCFNGCGLRSITDEGALNLVEALRVNQVCWVLFDVLRLLFFHKKRH
jgi:hypothetical protein